NTIVLPLGYGQTYAGNVADGIGFDVGKLRASTAMSFVPGAKITKTNDGPHLFAAIHTHHNIEGRGLVRVATVEEFEKEPDYAHNKAEYPEDLPLAPYPQDSKSSLYHTGEFDYKNTDVNKLGYAWGM